MNAGFRASVATIFFLFSAVTAHADETFVFKAGYQTLSPSGDLATKVAGLGTTLELQDDLGLGDSDNITAGLALSWDNFTMTANYLPLSFKGDVLLTHPVVFDGDVFVSGASLASEVTVDILDIGLTWYFINLDDLPIRLQLGLELSTKITDAQAKLNDATSGTSASVSETLPLPTMGLRGRVAFSDFIGLNGRLGYLGYGDNHFLDADVQVEVSPIPLLGVYGGYRYLDIEIDESELLLDAGFSGFYAGVFFRF